MTETGSVEDLRSQVRSIWNKKTLPSDKTLLMNKLNVSTTTIQKLLNGGKDDRQMLQDALAFLQKCDEINERSRIEKYAIAI